MKPNSFSLLLVFQFDFISSVTCLNPICSKVCRPAHEKIISVITQKLLYIRSQHTRSALLTV